MRVFAFVERHNVQDITSIVETQEKIVTLRQTSKIHEAEVSKILKEVVALQQFIVKECPHSTISKKSSYSNGGHDHLSVTKTWYECTICGKVLDNTMGYEYGGYQ